MEDLLKNDFTAHYSLPVPTITNFILNLKQNDKCEKCWSKNLCDGCTVQRFYNEEIHEFTTEPNEELCKITRLHLEQILLMITNIRKDPVAWMALVAKAKNRIIKSS